MARPLSHSLATVRHEGMNTIHNIVYTVSDLDAAKAIHTALLGTDPHTDTSYYVGYNVGGVEIALTPHGNQDRAPAPVAHVLVADIDAALAEIQQAGATLASPPNDVGGGLIATVTDADGTVLGLIQSS